MKYKFALCLIALFMIGGAVKTQAQNIAVKTNLLYDITATANVGVEVGLAPKWTLDLSGNLNAWSKNEHTKWKHWMLQPEARYWFCDRFSRHFVGAHLIGGAFNFGNINNNLSILGTDFSDVKRMKELLLEMKSKMQSSFVSAGHSLAAGRTLSYISVGSKIADELKGVSQYRFIENLLEKFDEKIDETILVMEELCQRIFVRERLVVDYTGTMEGLSEVQKISNEFYESLSYTKKKIEGPAKIQCVVRNEAFKTSGQVQFVCRAGNYKKKGLEYTGALKVLRVMMGYDYLWNNVRVKGGAYGCSLSLSISNDILFGSFSDPNVANTYNVYDSVATYLEEFNPNIDEIIPKWRSDYNDIRRNAAKEKRIWI